MTPDLFADRLRDADLDRYLAALYAPAEARPALFALFALDLELAEVVRTTTQPMIGLIRLAWWREALERLDHKPPPAQPLLEAAAERILPRGVPGEALSKIEAGFAVLLEEPLDVAAYADGRGGALFELAAQICGWPIDGAREAGNLWALGELRRERPDLDIPEPSPVNAAARPLRGLADLARRDLATSPGRRGSPSRQLRLLWSMLRPGR